MYNLAATALLLIAVAFLVPSSAGGLQYSNTVQCRIFYDESDLTELLQFLVVNSTTVQQTCQKNEAFTNSYYNYLYCNLTSLTSSFRYRLVALDCNEQLGLCQQLLKVYLIRMSKQLSSSCEHWSSRSGQHFCKVFKVKKTAKFSDVFQMGLDLLLQWICSISIHARAQPTCQAVDQCVFLTIKELIKQVASLASPGTNLVPETSFDSCVCRDQYLSIDPTASIAQCLCCPPSTEKSLSSLGECKLEKRFLHPQPMRQCSMDCPNLCQPLPASPQKCLSIWSPERLKNQTDSPDSSTNLPLTNVTGEAIEEGSKRDNITYNNQTEIFANLFSLSDIGIRLVLPSQSISIPFSPSTPIPATSSKPKDEEAWVIPLVAMGVKLVPQQSPLPAQSTLNVSSESWKCQLPNITNGFVTYNGKIVEQSEQSAFEEHTVISILCDVGYELHSKLNANMAFCIQSGNWIPEIGVCERIDKNFCSLPLSSDYEVNIIGNPYSVVKNVSQEVPVPFGTAITIKCSNDSSTSTGAACIDGNWIPTPPFCSSEQAIIASTTSMLTASTTQSTLNVSIESGTQSSLNTSTDHTTTTESSKCQLPNITNGYARFYEIEESEKTTAFEVHSIIAISCNAGYELRSKMNADMAFCLQSGRWIPEIGVCEEVVTGNCTLPSSSDYEIGIIGNTCQPLTNSSMGNQWVSYGTAIAIKCSNDSLASESACFHGNWIPSPPLCTSHERLIVPTYSSQNDQGGNSTAVD